MKTKIMIDMLLPLSAVGMIFLTACASDGGKDLKETSRHTHPDHFHGDHVHHGYPAHSHYHETHSNEHERSEPTSGVRVDPSGPDIGSSLDKTSDSLL